MTLMAEAFAMIVWQKLHSKF